MAEQEEEDVIEVEGKVIQVLPGTMFRIELANKHVVLGAISGRLRKNFIKIIVGDMVKMEMNPSDISKARITYRIKNQSYRPGPRPPMRRR
jgi:translation initiation factor IF-1